MSMTKPRDLVRTPTGATGVVIEILPRGEREVFLLNGTYLRIRDSLLFIVRPARPQAWPDFPRKWRA